MKKLSIFAAITVLAVFLISCGSVRILNQTPNSLVLQSAAATKYEAKANALKKAREIFKGAAVKESKEAECNQEYAMSGEADVDSAEVSGRTYWSCTVFIEKE